MLQTSSMPDDWQAIGTKPTQHPEMACAIAPSQQAHVEPLLTPTKIIFLVVKIARISLFNLWLFPIDIRNTNRVYVLSNGEAVRPHERYIVSTTETTIIMNFRNDVAIHNHKGQT